MSYFNSQKNKDDCFWKQKSNQKLLTQILNCDKVYINENITQSDYHLGIDAVAKKKVKNDYNFYYYISHSVSLRTRFDKRFSDLNFRNSLSNNQSELAKILAYAEEGSNYAKYFVQFFDVENNKAKFCVKWRTEDIAVFTYDHLENLDSYYKTSTNRYDLPISEAIHYNAICYNLSNDQATKVNYNYIKSTYRK
jgi:hypothetical protein